jgi:hypothetical protein
MSDLTSRPCPPSDWTLDLPIAAHASVRDLLLVYAISLPEPEAKFAASPFPLPDDAAFGREIQTVWLLTVLWRFFSRRILQEVK